MGTLTLHYVVGLSKQDSHLSHFLAACGIGVDFVDLVAAIGIRLTLDGDIPSLYGI